MLRTREHRTAVGVGVLALLGLSGCASSIERRPGGAYVGAGGSSSELVFAGSDVPASEAGEELWRRDAMLGVREERDAVSRLMFPDPPAPDLYDLRRLYLSTSMTESVYYFHGRRFWRREREWR